MGNRRKAKIIFAIGFTLFMAFVLIVSYDIMKKTTFPGAKKNLKERIMNQDKVNDSLDVVHDSIEENQEYGQGKNEQE